MPNRLKGLRGDEVSLVPDAANRRRFLLQKGAVDEIAVHEAADAHDLEALRELAAMADGGDEDARAKLQELADAGDENAAQLLTELDTTADAEEKAMPYKVHDSGPHHTLLQRVEIERSAELVRARKSALRKAEAPDPVQAVIRHIGALQKASFATATGALTAELDRLALLERQKDPFLTAGQATARVSKSAAGACLANVARDVRADVLDLPGLLQTLADEGSIDLLQRTAFELRAAR
jgi:hypothetical protein